MINCESTLPGLINSPLNMTRKYSAKILFRYVSNSKHGHTCSMHVYEFCKSMHDFVFCSLVMWIMNRRVIFLVKRC